ncbi:MAG: arylamine N-acetyltransferase [Gallionella sp.]
MKAENFLLQKYFDRIAFKGEARPDIATVTELMRCQLFTVPFENLDVQAGKIISLEPEEIVDKIINRRRGGYCFEVNGLFAMALDALGIPYQFVAARPMMYPVRKPRTHMALVVKADDREWLCDLGFGNYGIQMPMRLDLLDAEVKQGFDTFMLRKPNQHEYLLQARIEGVWADQFAFDLSPQEWIDFAPANYFSSTHPDAFFVQKLVVVLHNANGRECLSGDTLKTVTDGRFEKRTISPEEKVAILNSRFGL